MIKREPKKKSGLIKSAFVFYEAGWAILSPLIKLDKTLRSHYNQKRLATTSLPAADIWVQAASAGEAYIASNIIRHFESDRSLTLLITAQTDQGLDLLEKTAGAINASNKKLTIHTAFCPFDTPSIMKTAVNQVNPKLAVFVELEMWPGFLRALKENGTPSIIVNGRLTEHSMKNYLKWPDLWRSFAPDKILAMSVEDEKRFARLFPDSSITYVPNIKFDTKTVDSDAISSENPLTPLDPLIEKRPFAVLGSVRKEEETKVMYIIEALARRMPEVIIGLFPRHMDRINTWKKLLAQTGIDFVEKSMLTPKRIESTVSQQRPLVIVWDQFGELKHAYGKASAAFLGGSLVPLGGQNFLEPLFSGVIPVSGRYYDNFSWAAGPLIQHRLLNIARDKHQAADFLYQDLCNPSSRQEVSLAASHLLDDLKGGTLKTCNEIQKLLKETT